MEGEDVVGSREAVGGKDGDGRRGRKRETESRCARVMLQQREEVEDEDVEAEEEEEEEPGGGERGGVEDQEETELERLRGGGERSCEWRRDGEQPRERPGPHVGDVQYCSNDAEPTPLATIFSLYLLGIHLVLYSGLLHFIPAASAACPPLFLRQPFFRVHRFHGEGVGATE